jgi:hypothetical protein
MRRRGTLRKRADACDLMEGEASSMGQVLALMSVLEKPAELPRRP